MPQTWKNQENDNKIYYLGATDLKKARKRNGNVEKSILLYGLAVPNRLFLFVGIRFPVFPHFLLTSNGFFGFASVFRFVFNF